ncbi:hypothetical protein [Novosphingobium sp. MMS21-SN21R]|uniref:hypothetical protein n=1 Tax=Novosphingobium sp. MMS21-SN21R TaxID=2969298 RepID=UPI0028869E55|nr:hypothetical protein [Novosphingobium sp. MMS21-SN21R]MDT0507450.1 hypothetical protein [Novosphingobium sp. MMS21-SN21R]
MSRKTPIARLTERGRPYLAALRYLRAEFDRDGLRANRALIAALAEERPRSQTQMWNDYANLLDFEPRWSLPSLFRGIVNPCCGELELAAASFRSFPRELH